MVRLWSSVIEEKLFMMRLKFFINIRLGGERGSDA